jgi:hypothetical protein
MKFALPSFKKNSSSSSVQDMDTYPPRYNDTRSLKSSSRKGCLAVNYDTAALFFAALTIGNGLISLVGGLQYFAAGGSLVPHLDAFQTGAGCILVILALFMLFLILTKLKVRSFLYIYFFANK